MTGRAKDQANALTRRWIVRASPQDDHAAREKARQAGVRFSDYIRRMSVTGRVIVRQAADDRADMASLTLALNRAGTLVIQQMAIAHSRGELPAELLRLNATLEQAIAAVLIRQGF